MSKYVRALLLSLSRCAHIFIVNSHLHSHNAHMFIMYICNTFFHYFIAYTNNYLIPIFITMNVTNTNSVTALFSLSLFHSVVCDLYDRAAAVASYMIVCAPVFNIQYLFFFSFYIILSFLSFKKNFVHISIRLYDRQSYLNRLNETIHSVSHR